MEIEIALEQAIASLDPMYREVLVLRDVEGLTAPGRRGDGTQRGGGEEPAAPRARGDPRRRRALLGFGAAEAARGAPSASPPERCPDIVELFSKHLEGEIDANLCAEMERHLARCPSCDARCQSLQKTLALCKAAPLPRCPRPCRRRSGRR